MTQIPEAPNCPCCNNYSPPRLKKGNVQYWQCISCKTVFCDELDNSGKVGGEHEVGRNESQNHERIARVEQLLGGAPKDQVTILDFGCGHALFINDLKKHGYTHVDGYDAYNPEFSKIPPPNTYDICTMTETIEHCVSPFYELDAINRSLKIGGGLIIETSFIDVAVEENIPLEEFFYISPAHGHSTIFSHHGLDVMLCLKGFVPFKHVNRHVRQYLKIR
jgi:hypothetical protein